MTILQIITYSSIPFFFTVFSFGIILLMQFTS